MPVKLRIKKHNPCRAQVKRHRRLRMRPDILPHRPHPIIPTNPLNNNNRITMLASQTSIKYPLTQRLSPNIQINKIKSANPCQNLR